MGEECFEDCLFQALEAFEEASAGEKSDNTLM